MTVWFVSRHEGAKAFGRKHGYASARYIDHLDPALIRPGDTVAGNLPINLAALVAARGGRYLHLAVNPPPGRRGEELSLEELEGYGARFVEYRITPPWRWPPYLTRLAAANSGRLGRIDGVVRHWRRRLAERPWRLVLTIGGLVLVGFIAANTLSAVIADALGLGAAEPSFGFGRLLLLVLLVALYGAAVYLLSRFVGAILWSRMRPLGGADARCAALIMPMSPLGRHHTLKDAAEALARFRPAPDAPPDTSAYAATTEKYDAYTHTPDGQSCDERDLKRMAVPWQQNVRAAFHHGTALKRVLVLCSAEGNAQWAEFHAFMSAFLPGIAIDRVKTAGGGAEPFTLHGAEQDYTDYSFVREGYNRGVDQILAAAAMEQEPLLEADVCIDATPAQKPCSIAAAIVTLNRDLKLSYVSMKGEVSVYDAEIGTADSLARSIAP